MCHCYDYIMLLCRCNKILPLCCPIIATIWPRTGSVAVYLLLFPNFNALEKDALSVLSALLPFFYVADTRTSNLRRSGASSMIQAHCIAPQKDFQVLAQLIRKLENLNNTGCNSYQKSKIILLLRTFSPPYINTLLVFPLANIGWLCYSVYVERLLFLPLLFPTEYK